MDLAMCSSFGLLLGTHSLTWTCRSTSFFRRRNPRCCWKHDMIS